MVNVLSTVFGSLRRFLHSLRVATVVSCRYVLRSDSQGVLRFGTPEGTPPSLRTPCSSPLQTSLPSTPFATFRSFRKVSGIQKSLENTPFFCSLALKKKFARTLFSRGQFTTEDRAILGPNQQFFWGENLTERGPKTSKHFRKVFSGF